MTLRIRPASEAFDALYLGLLANITPGSQFIRAPIVLPYTENEPYPFIIEASPGDIVEVYVNNVLQTRRVMTLNQTELGLILQPGKNFIQVKTSLEDYLILVAATNYATFLRAWARQFYNYVQVKVDDSERQLNSKFSLRSIEHQLEFQKLLPPTRVLRTLAGKIAIRAMMNETGSTRGVDDITTAISNTTPVVVPTQVNLRKFEPAVYTLYDKAHDFGGYEFNIWIPNIAAATWAAFIKLADNLDDSIIKLTDVSDSKVSFEYQGVPSYYVFDFENPANDIVSIITNLLDCFFAVSVSAEQLTQAELVFCAWYRTGGTVVDVPLEYDPETQTSLDPSDPLSDGWIGSNLESDLDSGIPLDAVANTTLLADLGCAFEPLPLLFGSSLLETELYISPSAYATLVTDGSDTGWILGETQLGIDDILEDI
jgi:hypothetical protein